MLPFLGQLLRRFVLLHQLFSSSGTFISKWATPAGTNDGEIHYPTSIAVNKIGHVIVSGSNGVQIFDATGTFLMKLVAPQGGAFSDAHVAVDNKGVGQIIVTDINNHKIHLYGSGGTYISSFGSGGSENGEFNEPRGVSIDDQGNIYVCDRLNNRIVKLT
jgi:tripartite motif-containing protein 71